MDRIMYDTYNTVTDDGTANSICREDEVTTYYTNTIEERREEVHEQDSEKDRDPYPWLDEEQPVRGFRPQGQRVVCCRPVPPHALRAVRRLVYRGNPKTPGRKQDRITRCDTE